MAAPKGNEFWKQRSSFGRKPQFETAEQLWEACQQYFLWAEENPLYEHKAFSFEGNVKIEKIPKPRAMTILGMCIYIDITHQTWRNYVARDEYLEVCTQVEQVIRTQKFELASADLLNASIIARDLGLADKRELKATVAEMDEKEIDARLKALIAESSGDDEDADA